MDTDVFIEIDRLFGEKNNQSYAEAIDLLTPLAQSNNSKAMGYLGKAYHFGKGVKKNLQKATELLTIPAKSSAKWSNELFDVYWAIDDPNKYQLMIHIASNFAYRGDPGSMGRLGRMYRDGKGVIRDYDESAKWLRKATTLNNKWYVELYEVLILNNTIDSITEARDIAPLLAGFDKKYNVQSPTTGLKYSEPVANILCESPLLNPEKAFKKLVNCTENNPPAYIEKICHSFKNPKLDLLSKIATDNNEFDATLFALVAEAELFNQCNHSIHLLYGTDSSSLFGYLLFLLKMINQKYEQISSKTIVTVLNNILDYGKTHGVCSDLEIKLFFKEIRLCNPCLNKIQECSYSLLQAFDMICRINNVVYLIFSGNLIGQCRHEGFIPWDDDVDVFMMRSDLEKLRMALERDTYPFSVITKPHSTRGGRVIMSNQFRLKRNKKVAIGIMVFDYIDDGSDDTWDRYQSIKMELREHVDLELAKSRSIGEDPRKNKKIPELYAEYNREMVSQLGSNKKTHVIVGLDSANPNKKYLFKTETLFPIKYALFCDKKFPIPNDPDVILNEIYGGVWKFPKDMYNHAHINWDEKTFLLMDKYNKYLLEFIESLKLPDDDKTTSWLTQ